MVQQVVAILYLECEELITNGEDVGQTLRCVNVTKGFSPLYGSFATLDVYNLVVYQIKTDDRHGLFDVLLVLLQHFGIRVGRWSFIKSVHNFPKIHGWQ